MSLSTKANQMHRLQKHKGYVANNWSFTKGGSDELRHFKTEPWVTDILTITEQQILNQRKSLISWGSVESSICVEKYRSTTFNT